MYTGPGEYLAMLLFLVTSPKNSFSPSSRFAKGNPNTGFDFSIESGSFPNDVFACLESSCSAKDVRADK